MPVHGFHTDRMVEAETPLAEQIGRHGHISPPDAIGHLAYGTQGFLMMPFQALSPSVERQGIVLP